MLSSLDPSLLNVALNLAQFVLTTFCYVALLLIRAERRHNHGVRTHVATVNGIALTLATMHQQLPLETRVQLYEVMKAESEAALRDLDERFVELRPFRRNIWRTTSAPERVRS